MSTYKVILETTTRQEEFFIKTDKTVAQIEEHYTGMYLVKNIEVVPVPEYFAGVIKVYETI